MFRRTIGFLNGADAATLILVTGAFREICPRAEKPKTVVHIQKPIDKEVWVSGAEIQTLAADARTWAFTAEKKRTARNSKFLKKVRGSLSTSSVKKIQPIQNPVLHRKAPIPSVNAFLVEFLTKAFIHWMPWPLQWKSLFFTDFCFIATPSGHQKSEEGHGHFWGLCGGVVPTRAGGCLQGGGRPKYLLAPCKTRHDGVELTGGHA